MTNTAQYEPLEDDGTYQTRSNGALYRLTPDKGAKVDGVIVVGMTYHAVKGERYGDETNAPEMWIDYTPSRNDDMGRHLLTVNGKEYGEGFGNTVSGRVQFHPAREWCDYYPVVTVGGQSYEVRASIGQWDNVSDAAGRVLNATATAIALEYVTDERWHAQRVKMARRDVERAEKAAAEASDALTEAVDRLAIVVNEAPNVRR